MCYLSVQQYSYVRLHVRSAVFLQSMILYRASGKRLPPRDPFLTHKKKKRKTKKKKKKKEERDKNQYRGEMEYSLMEYFVASFCENEPAKQINVCWFYSGSSRHSLGRHRGDASGEQFSSAHERQFDSA